MFYKTVEGRYLGCNAAFENFFGMDRCNLIGRTAFDICPPELARVYKEQDDKLFAHPGTQVYESRLKDQRGELHQVVFNKATFEDSAGRVAGLIGIILDVTERQQQEERMSEQLEELRRWQAVTLGREERVAELKREVNALAARLDLPVPYPSAGAES